MRHIVILGFRVPTTSVGARGEGVRGVGGEGSKAYAILGFRVPTTCDDKNLDYHI